MSNNNAPFGFRVFRRRDGGAPTMGQERFVINSSDTVAYFTGDPVSVSAGVIAKYDGSTSANFFTGIFNGCEYYSPTVGRVVWSSYFPASVSSSSPVTAYVQTDPELEFVVQGSTTPFLSSQIGQNANIVTATSSLGNTTTGISVVVLASTQVTNSSSLPFRFVDLYSNVAPPGVPGTDNANNFNIAVVGINQSARHAGSASS